MKTRIHVNQHKIKANKKNGTRETVLTVKTSKSNAYGHEVIIYGPCRVVYSPDNPLSCGATVYIECSCEVEVIQHAKSGGLRKEQKKKGTRSSVVQCLQTGQTSK